MPLYPEEYEFLEREGWKALLTLFAEHDVSTEIAVGRPSVVPGK